MPFTEPIFNKIHHFISEQTVLSFSSLTLLVGPCSL